MEKVFPIAVPELPVTDMKASLDYYEKRLGFNIDWSEIPSGISGVSRGQCRIFLTDRAFRETLANFSPVVTWLNLDSKAEVDAQHTEWKTNGAIITAPPESKPWKLHEFCATDLDGNIFRVFYDYTQDV